MKCQEDICLTCADVAGVVKESTLQVGAMGDSWDRDTATAVLTQYFAHEQDSIVKALEAVGLVFCIAWHRFNSS